jgi:protein phosphatase
VHPHRSLLLKVLNGQPVNEPDLTRLRLAVGDRLLFCSDGLCGLVDDATIAEALREADLETALRRLVGEARAEGGIDNITVILADVVDSDGTTGAVVLGAAAERELSPGSAVGATRPGGRVQDESVQHEPVQDEAVQHEAARDAAELGERVGAASPGTAAPVTAGEDEARYSPQPPHQRRLRRPLLGLLLLLLVAAAGLGTAYAWTRTQYYVGNAGEQVAIYQGLPERVVIPLSRVYEVQPLTLAALPDFYAEQVRAGIEVSSLASARQAVTELTEASKRCAAGEPTATPTPKPSPSGKAKPSPTGKVQPKPKASPLPSARSSSPSAPATAGPGC